MTRVLLTGLSGVGKSSVVRELRRRGFVALDMDEEGWSFFDAAGNQLWNEKRLEAFLHTESRSPFFISGCSESQIRFRPHFSHLILLATPRETLLARIAARADNPYGKRPEEIAEILKNLEEIEPLLRKSATHLLDASQPLEQVVERILEISQKTTRKRIAMSSPLKCTKLNSASVNHRRI